MKSKKHLLLGIAGILSIVVFFMIFICPLYLEISGHKEVYDFNMVYFGKDVKAATGGLVGFILILIAGLILSGDTIIFLLHRTLGDKLERIITVLSMVLLLIGAILVFCTKAFFLSANGIEDFSKYVHLCAGPILGGILALIACGVAGVGEFVFKD